MAKKQSPAADSKSKKASPRTKTTVKRSAKSNSGNNPQEKTPVLKLDKTMDRLKELGDKLAKSAEKGLYDETTRDQLRKLKDKLSEAADKGVHAIRDAAGKIHQFAGDATELTRLKIELHNLQKEREKFLILMGEQLRNLHKSDKLRNIKAKLKYDFEKIDEIEKTIAEKEREAARLAADIKPVK